MLVFLLITGLFLWVFPGAYNIPDSGYATLNGLFELAPWLYLFLVPAITMRLFADEKRSGTIELLLTRPLSDSKLVFAKFLSGLILVIFSLLPTLLYFYSVYKLGNPVGSIDTGATWGSFIGLFLLAAIYVAIGVFASSLTDNQIVSFIVAVLLSFVFYLGFDFIGSSGIPYLFEQLFNWLSINNHYNSVSRGVIDLRDLVYFVGMTVFFLVATAFFLRTGNWRNRKKRSKAIVFSVILIAVFFVSNNFLYRIDLTADKRFSLANQSKNVVANLDKPIYVELYLAGELEPGLRNIQTEVIEKIAVLNVYSGKPIRFRIFDPYSISDSKKQTNFINELTQKGIKPISFRHKTEKGVSTKLIFPAAVLKYGDKEIAVNLLKNNPGVSYEVNFNNSVESVEFELIRAIHKLTVQQKSKLAFLQGHNEANKYQLADISGAIAADFKIDFVTTEQLKNNISEYKILVIADPVQPFTENEKIVIDQFIMNGGKTMFLISPVQVSLDSLSKGFQTYSFPRDLNLTDILFKYGFRLNYELLQDVDCIQIPVDVAPLGGQPQYSLHPWYYSPLLTPGNGHQLSRNLNRVRSEFVSSVDTVNTEFDVKRSVILSTSKNARTVKSPSSVSLKNIDNPPARELFNKSYIPVGIIAEGIFSSAYKNRMVESFGYKTGQIIEKSKPTKLIVIANGGLIKNKVNYSTNPPQIQKMGFDRVSKITFGNKEFFVNAISYLNDDSGLMQLRNRNIKLRLLDKVKIRDEKVYWQWLNTGLPIVIVLLFGVVYNVLRRRRFSR